MIIVTGSVTAHADTFAELRRVSLDYVLRSRTEDGCLRHSVQADCEHPLRLVFYEEWRNMAALTAHFRVAGSVAFIVEVRRLADTSEAVTLYAATRIDLPRG